MNLKLYFRAITTHMFQPRFVSGSKSIFGDQINYENSHFQMMRIHCVDGFNISLQINYLNYCSTEAGFRKFGFDWEEVEWGMSSLHEPRLDYWSDQPGDSRKGVGRIPTDEIQSILDEEHGGIDWEATLSLERCLHFHHLMMEKELAPIR